MTLNRGIIPAFNVLQAPYIKIDATIIQNGVTNGKINIPSRKDYAIAPSAKKIATYIINQIFGSDLVVQSEDMNIGWLMPSLKEALELSIYEEEAFIYIHIYDNKVYLQSLGKNDIHDLVQKFDKIESCTIKEVFNIGKDEIYELHRKIIIDNGVSYLTFKAYEVDSNNKKIPITIELFNHKTGNEYIDSYILPYEVLINTDIGQDFFKDSRKLLIKEMRVVDVLADEIEKTRTRIATTQHYQSGDIVGSWKPSSNYQPTQLTVGNLQDFFTLLPGDKEHHLFQYLQGDVRVESYVETFKFYDYQCIQLAGLSPASFGYEKDAYMNNANINLSKNSSDMTVEAIKTQIDPQITKLLTNIAKAQTALNIQDNRLPNKLSWDYGLNEKIDDMKKLQVLRSIQGVSGVPMKYKAQIIFPILKKLISDDSFELNDKEIQELVDEWNEETKDKPIIFGEI